MNINELLPQIPIFCTLDSEELEIVKKHLEKKVLHENEIVFEEGEIGNAMYIIAIGAVKAIKRIDENNYKVVGTFTDMDFFGELALLDGQPRSAGAVVTRSTVLLKLSFDNFRKLINSHPFTALKIISQIACHLSIRLRETNMKLAELESFRLLK